jgi:hAT-like transposase, RNase-H fold
MSGSTYPTLSTTVPLYNSLIDHIEDTIATDDIEQTIYDAAVECKTKLLGYYNKTNNACLIATVLDPRIKLRYYKDNEWGDDLIGSIQQV